MRRLRAEREHRGQTLVEFAMVLPILILLLVGVFDLGRAVYANHTISNAAREAARLAIVDQNVPNVEAEAVARAVGLGITASEVSVAFRTADLSGTCSSPYDVGCVAEVTVDYQYTAATPIVGNLVGVVNMSAVTRLPVERTYATP